MTIKTSYIYCACFYGHFLNLHVMCQYIYFVGQTPADEMNIIHVYI